jgi:mono/diheme cytochrome c family protein
MRTDVFALGLAVLLGVGASEGVVAADPAPYTVVDGNAVDKTTFAGWRTWRALSCERCHGAEQEGLVGPSLVDSFKRLTKGEFVQTVTNGRPDKGMPNFGGVQLLADNVDGLYAYLKGRSDGAIQPGRLHELQ